MCKCVRGLFLGFLSYKNKKNVFNPHSSFLNPVLGVFAREIGVFASKIEVFARKIGVFARKMPVFAIKIGNFARGIPVLAGKIPVLAPGALILASRLWREMWMPRLLIPSHPEKAPRNRRFAVGD